MTEEYVSRSEYADFRDDLRDDLKSFKTDIRRELVLMFAAAVPIGGVFSGAAQHYLKANPATHAAMHAVVQITHIF